MSLSWSMTTCELCTADVPYAFDEHHRACEAIELGLLATAADSAVRPAAMLAFSDLIPPVRDRVQCQVCAGQEAARAHDRYIGEPQPECWSCGGTGWVEPT